MPLPLASAILLPLVLQGTFQSDLAAVTISRSFLVHISRPLSSSHWLAEPLLVLSALFLCQQLALHAWTAPKTSRKHMPLNNNDSTTPTAYNATGGATSFFHSLIISPSPHWGRCFDWPCFIQLKTEVKYSAQKVQSWAVKVPISVPDIDFVYKLELVWLQVIERNKNSNGFNQDILFLHCKKPRLVQQQNSGRTDVSLDAGMVPLTHLPPEPGVKGPP